MKRALWTILVLLSVLGGPMISQGAAPVVDDRELLRIAEKLLDEAERQHSVNQRMGQAILTLRVLVEDLRSNEMMTEGQGAKLDATATVLRKLSDKHVPAAATALETARKELAARQDNLTSADAEIATILSHLTEVLRKSAASNPARELATNLRVIIEKQEILRDQTREWGKQMLLGAADAKSASRGLGEAQGQLGKLLSVFRDALKQEIGNSPEAGKDKLAAADKLLEEKRVDRTFALASQRIAEFKAIDAVAQQDKALADLREVEKLLRSDAGDTRLADLKKSREQVKDLLNKQQQVREKTEALTKTASDKSEKTDAPKKPEAANKDQPKSEPGQKPEGPKEGDKTPEAAKPDAPTPQDKAAEQQRNNLQLEQRKVGNETQETAQDQPSPEAKKDLEEARDEMNKAEKNLAQNKPQDATDAQKNAEKKLNDALNKLDEQIAKAEEPPPTPAAQTPPTDPMQQAMNEMKDLEGEQAKTNEQTGKSEAKDLPKQEPGQSDLAKKAEQLSKQLEQASAPQPKPSEDKPSAQPPQSPEQKQAASDLKQAAQEMQKAAQAMQSQNKPEAQKHQENAMNALKKAQQQMQTAMAQANPIQQAMNEMKNLEDSQGKTNEQTSQSEAKDLPKQEPQQSGLAQQAQQLSQQMSQQTPSTPQEQQAQQQMAQAAQAMQQAAQAMQNQNKSEAQKQQAQAMQALKQAQQQMQMAMSEQQQQQQQSQQEQLTLEGKGSERQANDRGGEDPLRDGSKWEAMSPRERDAVYQNYARELPLEYRQLLEDYYESLAK